MKLLKNHIFTYLIKTSEGIFTRYVGPRRTKDIPIVQPEDTIRYSYKEYDGRWHEDNKQ